MTAEPARSTTDASLRQLVGDLLAVALAPALLVAVYLLVPTPVQERFVLHPDSANPVLFFTAAYLHLTDAHLAGNVLGYALAALSAYLLCLLLGDRRWFFLTTAVLLVGLPIPVNWTSLVALDLYFSEWSATVRGFSGVAAGFGGFALAALLAYVRRRTDLRTAIYAGLAAVLLLLWEVLVIYAREVPPLPTALVVLGVGLCAVEIGRHRPVDWSAMTRSEWIAVAGGVLVFAWTVAVLAVLISGLFPAEVLSGDRFTNVFAHAIGFGYGFALAAWGYRYWGSRGPARG